MLQPHTLVLDLADADARAVADQGLRVAVARPAGRRPPNVVWLALPPSVSTRITWSHDCGVFAAAVPERAGVPVEVRASVYPAVEGALYSFVPGRFKEPVADPRIPRRHYTVHNGAAFHAAFGLLQAAHVDGIAIVAPVSAIVVPAGGRADFVAADDLFVWTQRDVAHGVAIGSVPISATAVRFALHDAVRRLRYDPGTASFVPSRENEP